MSEAHSIPMSVKILSGVVMALIGAVIGYLVVYWWVFGNFNEVLDTSVLKNQIIANQHASDVKAQLQDLGYRFEDDEFFQLHHPSSVNYHADVLGGYVPIETEEGPKKEAFYFYDDSGQAYYFTTDDNNQIDPESMTPLIMH